MMTVVITIIIIISRASASCVKSSWRRHNCKYLLCSGFPFASPTHILRTVQPSYPSSEHSFPSTFFLDFAFLSRSQILYLAAAKSGRKTRAAITGTDRAPFSSWLLYLPSSGALPSKLGQSDREKVLKDDIKVKPLVFDLQRTPQKHRLMMASSFSQRSSKAVNISSLCLSLCY